MRHHCVADNNSRVVAKYSTPKQELPVQNPLLSDSTFCCLAGALNTSAPMNNSLHHSLPPILTTVFISSFQLSKMVQKDAEQESEMRAEIQEMKKEQSSISMMDEFARYARLERKINKMTDKLKTHGGETKVDTITGIHRIKHLLEGCCFVLVIYSQIVLSDFYWKCRILCLPHLCVAATADSHI